MCGLVHVVLHIHNVVHVCMPGGTVQYLTALSPLEFVTLEVKLKDGAFFVTDTVGSSLGTAPSPTQGHLLPGDFVIALAPRGRLMGQLDRPNAALVVWRRGDDAIWTPFEFAVHPRQGCSAEGTGVTVRASVLCVVPSPLPSTTSRRCNRVVFFC